MLGANGYSLRGRIYFKQRKFKDSYGAVPRRATPLRAAALGGSGAGGTGDGGDRSLRRAPTVLVGFMAAVVVLILWGVSLIPVVGSWIVAALVIALRWRLLPSLVCANCRGATSQRTGARSSPASLLARRLALGVGAATFAVWNASRSTCCTASGLVESNIADRRRTAGNPAFTATMYGWPRLLARYSRSPQAAAA